MSLSTPSFSRPSLYSLPKDITFGKYGIVYFLSYEDRSTLARVCRKFREAIIDNRFFEQATPLSPLSWPDPTYAYRLFARYRGAITHITYRTQLIGHSDFISQIIQQRDHTLLTLSIDGTLRIWSKEGFSISCHDLPFAFGEIRQLRDGRIIKLENKILAWRLDDNSMSTLIEVEEDKLITSMRELKDGRILTCVMDNTVRLWTEKGEQLLCLYHSKMISLAEPLTKKRLLTITIDGTIHIWGEGGNKLSSWKAEIGEHISRAWLLKDETIAIADSTNTVYIYNIDGQLITKFATESLGWIIQVLLLADGRLITVSVHNEARLWSRLGELLSDFDNQRIWQVLQLRCNKLAVLSSSSNGTIYIYELTGKETFLAKGELPAPFASRIQELPDGRLAVDYSSKNEVDILGLDLALKP